MATVFITGIAGFLGSHLADTLIARGHSVAGIDNLIGGDLNNVAGNVVFQELDCCEHEEVRSFLSDFKPDIVYHCAATAYEGLSVFSPHLIAKNIVEASASVFSAAISTGVKRIVFCSSMARYGRGEPPFSEADVLAPQDPYGISKVSAEQLLKNLCRTHNVEYSIAVPHNIIGARQKYDDPYRNVAAIMLNLMAYGRSPVIYGDGLQKRCFSHVDDCISCLVCMGFDDRAAGGTFNIGPDQGAVTINELFDRCAKISGFNGQPIYMPGRPQEVKLAWCSSDLARQDLSYETTKTLDDGLKDLYEHIMHCGPKPFNYHLPIEIVCDNTPCTWKDRLF